MHVRLLVLSAVSVALAGVPAQTQTLDPLPVMQVASAPLEWQLFSSTEGRFQVQMPGIPLDETQTIDFLSLYVASLEASRDRFLVAYADYPREVVDRQDPTPILQGVQQGFVSRIQGEVLAERSVNLSGYPGREIRYQTASGGEGVARFYLVEERLYQVVISTANEPTNRFDRDADRFLNSFRLQ